MEQQFEQQGQPTGSSVGARLKAAREAAGMGLGEVADRLKLSMRQLEAIERDDFTILPGATFVRGFVRNYARFLQIDPEPLMHALDRQFPSAVNDVANLVRDGAHEAPGHSGETPASDEGGSSGKWIVGLLVVAALGGGVAWLASNHGGDSRPTADASSAIATELSSAPMGEASAPAAFSAETPASAPAAVVAPSPASAPQPVKTASVASAPVPLASPLVKPQASAAVAAAASGKLVLTVKEAEAWVSVVDATGKKLVFQTLQPGSTQEAVGTPPFKLVIGNASQVAVNFNGQAVDLTDKIRGTTAKLELK
ncbi:helix-turn-helix domain-containing protein [Chromobacterium haemolyticum]|uniref:Helix-turn-helix domain-containing protein n=1 Tax=Chromobacterium fluminis TaxID=3044269 RepID=A0ABX0LHU0_9NEIS|nr:RodZ domain-containing protein [Chromobacterium haemolyticum]NHR08478.1 helix-turn-helix domain-containing protein [Chromobacterium haemolyticum]